VDRGSAQYVPGGTRLAQLENAIANDVSPDRFARRREIGRQPLAAMVRLQDRVIGAVARVGGVGAGWK
jgi:hypothetical protein